MRRGGGVLDEGGGTKLGEVGDDENADGDALNCPIDEDDPLDDNEELIESESTPKLEEMADDKSSTLALPLIEIEEAPAVEPVELDDEAI